MATSKSHHRRPKIRNLEQIIMVLNLGNNNTLLTSKNTTIEEGVGGQNVTLIEDLNVSPLNSAGISSSSITHPDITGSFFDMISSDLARVWKIGNNATAVNVSVITIDIGRILKLIVTGIQYISKVSAAGDTTKLKIEYSTDNSNWTTWFDITYTPADEGDYDKFLFNKTYRYLKITIDTDTTAAVEGSISLNYLKMTR